MSDEHPNLEDRVVESKDFGYEIHDVNIPAIATLAILCIGVIVGAIFLLDGYFVYFKEQLIREANIVEPAALNELRANEHDILTTYGVIDQEQGAYRIPIDRAMSLVAEDEFRKQMKSSVQP